jgi:hypothetical protein
MPITQLPTFEIYNMNLGEVLGTYVAETEDAALDAMARDYGFADYAAVVADYGLTVEAAKSELQIVEVR